MSEDNPCKDCEKTYVGCKHACLKYALTQKDSPGYANAVFTDNAIKNGSKTVAEIIAKVNAEFHKSWAHRRRRSRKKKEGGNE